MLQEMSFLKESASALLIYPTPKILDKDVLFLVLLALPLMLVIVK